MLELKTINCWIRHFKRRLEMYENRDEKNIPMGKEYYKSELLYWQKRKENFKA